MNEKIIAGTALKVLSLEDSVRDFEIIREQLIDAGYHLNMSRVEKEKELESSISGNQYDIILADFKLPGFDAFGALRLCNAICPDVPFICVSGSIGEETAIELIKQGAVDYVLKDRLARLPFAVKRALDEAKAKEIMRRAEEDIKKLSLHQQALLAAIPDIIMEVDTNKIYTWANESGIDFFGKDVVGKPADFYFVREQNTYNAVRPVFEGVEDVVYVESWQRRKDGQGRLLAWRCRSLKDMKGNVIGVLSSASDITDRKRNEEALKESEKKYHLLADNVNDVIFVLDMNLNYTYVSPSVKILRGYEPEELLHQTPAETVTPSSMELAMKTLSEIMELEKSGRREEIPMSRTLQLEMMRKDKTTVWTEVKFSIIRDENRQPVGIMGVTRDITNRRKAEEQLHQSLENLRKSFSATIHAMVSATEMRDPYTAGHQLRVADLARAIAIEMGLPQEQIEGIRMAGTIHDIGKISIPAEILSKPTRLTDIEMSIIKEHPMTGYEMLKDLESPWPLAQIVYQHHERMNGSGYPRKLKGNKIIIEARIMAVADVMEAMASNRPYRPTIGINAALEEIEKNKGILYDNAVADTCLKLFREKKYHLA